MEINWPYLRMLLGIAEDNWLDAYDQPLVMMLEAEQVSVSIRCIKALYQGLKWGIDEDNQSNAYFLVEDENLIGIFADRTPSYLEPLTPCSYPITTAELIKFSKSQKSTWIRTIIFLEKNNFRLANSYRKGCQSDFLRNVGYYALNGIVMHYIGALEGSQVCETEILSMPFRLQTLSKSSLFQMVHDDPDAADRLLYQNSPLRLFYEESSPFNIDFEAEACGKQDIQPGEIVDALEREG